MVKKILICGMCLMLLLGVGVSAAREMPQGNPPEGFEMPQGAPPEGFEMPQGAPPEGFEMPQGMQGNTGGFPNGGQGQRPQGNTQNTDSTQNTQTEAKEQPAQKTDEGGEQQEQNAENMTPPDMNFDRGNMPNGFSFGGTQTEAEPMTFMGFVKEYQTPIISVVLLLLAFVFVKLYKRKKY